MRCPRHKGAPAVQSGKPAGETSKGIPSIAPARKPAAAPKGLENTPDAKLLSFIAKTASSSLKASNKDLDKYRYRKLDKDPKDYSGAISAPTMANKVFEIISGGLATGNSLMLYSGLAASGIVGAALFATGRHKLGIIDVGANSDLRQYDIMLPNPEVKVKQRDGKLPALEFTDYKKAADVERRKVNAEAAKRRIAIRNENTERVVKEHWRRLEEKATYARSRIVEDMENSGPSGHAGAALLYESFREQFYAIGAEHDPAAAALKRAEEIASYPMDEETKFLPYPPYLVRGISPEEKAAAHDIIDELRLMAESLSYQPKSVTRPLI